LQANAARRKGTIIVSDRGREREKKRYRRKDFLVQSDEELLAVSGSSSIALKKSFRTLKTSEERRPSRLDPTKGERRTREESGGLKAKIV